MKTVETIQCVFFFSHELTKAQSFTKNKFNQEILGGRSFSSTVLDIEASVME